jgi:hypothetical protein
MSGAVMPDGSTILGIYWENNHDTGTRVLYLVVSGIVPNDGWSSITVGGHLHYRQTATYDTSTGNTIWGWSTTNHFGNTVGATKVVTITGGGSPIIDYNGLNSSKIEITGWLEPPAGLDSSKIETTLWLDSHDLLSSKIEAALWLDPHNLLSSKIESQLWLDIPQIQASKIEMALWLDTGVVAAEDQPQISILW